MLAGLGVSKPRLYVVDATSLAALLLLFPPTFLLGNLLNAAGMLLLIALALHVGNLRIAAIEIPFLLLPLALSWLKHPLARQVAFILAYVVPTNR